MLEKYARAVTAMSAQLTQSDTRSWLYQWYIHAVPSVINGQPASKATELNRVFGAGSSPAKSLAQELWSTCQAHISGSDQNMFLPWHRMYLLAFEEAVRSVLEDDDFTLPYWNYTVPGSATRSGRSIPPAFRKEGDAKFGALFRKNRNTAGRNINAGDPMDKNTTVSPFNLDQMTIPSFPDTDGFNHQLDINLHGNVHVGVGDLSNMGRVPTAAGDPIFWLHHCNIDRIWAGWNKMGGSNPETSTHFAFADRNGKRIEMDSAKMGDTKVLGYEYDELPTITMAQVTTSTSGAAPPKVVASSDKDSTLLGNAATRIPLSPAAADGPISAAVAGTSAQQRLYLVISDLRCDAQPGTLYEAFLDLPANASPEVKRQHYLGTFNFFKAEDGAGDLQVRFDITGVMRDLSTRNQLGPQPAVTIVPVDAPAAAARASVGRVTVVRR